MTGIEPALSAWLRKLIGGGVSAEVMVLEEERQIIATGILLPEGLDGGRIVRMSMDHRHRRRGRGRRLVEELVRRVRERGMAEAHRGH